MSRREDTGPGHGAPPFPGPDKLQDWYDKLGRAGLRSTASAAHERTIDWIEQDLLAIPGITTRSEHFDVLRWQPVPAGDLEAAGALDVLTSGGTRRPIPVVGAVPYSKPTATEGRTGELVRLAADVPITSQNAAGKVVLRDFPHLDLPYSFMALNALHLTGDISLEGEESYDRGVLADDPIHMDLLAAGAAGAAGVIVAFDLPRDQMAGYFEPHKGTHYKVPAVFIGADEREMLRELSETPTSVSVTVRAEVEVAPTRNLIATLPGATSERIVLVTHTDGNTWVQENGPAALLGLATYFAGLPLAQRHRTIEFVFTSAHLHISREGSVRYALELDKNYAQDPVAFVIAVEHLGTRQLTPVARHDGPGRRLEFDDVAEVLMWAVGPSDVARKAVIAAVETRGLDRVLISPGLGGAVPDRVPEYGSFGGIGGSYHQRLLPSMALISGPWSMWAPSFGSSAIDPARFHQQVLAVSDVIHALGVVPLGELGGDYLAHRRERANGAATWPVDEPPESLDG